MTVSATVDSFTIKYSLYTNSGKPGDAIQFGMDFTLTSTVKRPLSQLIFPFSAVGTNRPGRWNIDNHNTGNDLASLIFVGAKGGTITDGPREISGRGKGVVRTRFAVYLVNLEANSVQSTGVQFGYSINTSDATPKTVLIGFARSNITTEQKAVMQARAPHIKFA